MKLPPKRAIVVAIAAVLATVLVTHGYWQQPVLSFLGIAAMAIAISATSRARPA